MKRSEIPQFIQKMNQMFADQTANLPFKKRTLEDLKAGFADGARSTFWQLVEEGHIQIEED